MRHPNSFYNQVQYAPTSKRLDKKEILFHNGHFYLLDTCQHLMEALHMHYKAHLLIGDPGTGKTHTSKHLIPALLKIIQSDEVEMEVKTSYQNLSDFENNMVDFKIIPWIEKNSAVWKKTPLVLLNETASNSDQLSINNIFDEISRLKNEGQNFLLPVLEDNQDRGFLLPQIGELIAIKKESVIFCLGNPLGKGVNTFNEALLDRVHIMELDYPPPELMALAIGEAGINNAKGYAKFADLKPLVDRSIDEDGKIEVIRCFNKILKMSYRSVKEVLFWLCRSPYPKKRLLEYVTVRKQLGIINLEEETYLEWISYDFDDMMYELGISE